MEPPDDGDLLSAPPPDNASDLPSQPKMGNSETSLNLTVEQFPYGQLGTPVAHIAQGTTLYKDSVWAPFQLQCDWELVHWAKMCGPTSSAMTDLLTIPGLVKGLGLSYHTSKELNSIIDKQLLGGSTPVFKTQDLEIGGEHLRFHYCEIILCIWALLDNPDDIILTPSHTCCIYNKMHTGDWWWSVWVSLESHRPGAMVIPLIISSDKTLLTVFCGKMAYPIYMGIGNIPKDICWKPSHMAQLLIGYIPTSKLEGITNKAACWRALANLFHSCMGKVLQFYGETGLTIMCGDGTWCHCHPIFTTFVGDYPEQTLVTLPHDQLGDFNSSNPNPNTTILVMSHFRTMSNHDTPCDYAAAINNYEIADKDPHRFNPAFYHLFWQYLPLMDIFLAITLDILHQLLQGGHHILLFTKGLPFSHVMGKEHKNICCGHSLMHVLRTVQAILDFVYLVQFPSHMTNTLKLLENSLSQFHDNMAMFIALGICTDFLIPKIHGMLHYQSSITLFGTMDNYNTKQLECLHIENPKGGYSASNHKDKHPQMTVYASTCNLTPLPPPELELRQPKMTKHPMCKSVSFKTLAEQYGTVEFQDMLPDYIAGINHPGASAATLIRFTPAGNSDNTDIVDGVVIWPEQKDACGQIVPGRFDTILVHGHRIAQLRVVFQLPTKVIDNIFPGQSAPIHLAYMEWFMPLSTTQDPNYQLHRVTRLMHGGRWHAMVISVESILRSVHLFPRFGPTTPPHWSSFSVLEQCTTFYVNLFSDRQSHLRFR
ncbi:hypothetical protein EI94DRAFT_1771512 [Lactarius quietus]|nr:hypothetical protein EI94DRAFT_1771512 [Lactarius quietus]